MPIPGAMTMLNLMTVPPARRPELLLSRLRDDGRYLISDPRSGACHQLGEQEHFLLMRLDGRETARAIRDAFEERFGEQLSAADLHGFLELAQERGLLHP